MPRYVKKFDTAQPPPVDWLWAAVLERQRVYGMDLKTLADIAGVGYGNMRGMMNMSPWEWKRKPRENVCRFFGIDINITPQIDGKLEVNIK